MQVWVLLAILSCFLYGCTTSHDGHASGLVKLRYGNFVSSAVAIGPSTILGAAHTLPDHSIDPSAIRINGAAPGSVMVIADGLAQKRRSSDVNFFTIHSHSVFEDFIILETDLLLTPTEYIIPDNLAEAMRSASRFELITRKRSTGEETRIVAKNIVYDIDHRVIAFTGKVTNLSLYYLSGSPLIARHRNGMHYLLGIVSGRGTIPIDGVFQTDTVLVCPVNMIPIKKEIRNHDAFQ